MAQCYFQKKRLGVLIRPKNTDLRIMYKIGAYNTLKIVKEVDFGLYLTDGHEEILLPRRYEPKGVMVEDSIEVFVYTDSEDRPIATTEKPFAVAGEFAFLKVKDVISIGAFLDWGIAKDLLVPLSEQSLAMREGERYVVYVYLDDKTNRVVASSKWSKFLKKETPEFKEGDQVDLLIAERTDLGFNAIINRSYQGLVYKSEIFGPLTIGDEVKGFIKKMREDGKIDLILQPGGYGHVEDAKELIHQYLKLNKGYLSIGDKSSPEQIYDTLKISKKAFKKAIGGLYKDRLIDISDHAIVLLGK